MAGDLTQAVVKHGIANKEYAYSESRHGDYLGSRGGHGLNEPVVRKDRKSTKNKVRSWVTHHINYLLMVSWVRIDEHKPATPRRLHRRRLLGRLAWMDEAALRYQVLARWPQGQRLPGSPSYTKLGYRKTAVPRKTHHQNRLKVKGQPSLQLRQSLDECTGGNYLTNQSRHGGRRVGN